MPEGAKRIATDRVEVEREVPEQSTASTAGLPSICPERKTSEIQHLCESGAYRALELSGYARIDLRLDEAGNVWVLEANPNPQIARGRRLRGVGARSRA